MVLSTEPSTRSPVTYTSPPIYFNRCSPPVNLVLQYEPTEYDATYVYQLPQDVPYTYSVALLKSNLQKAMRRQKVDICLSTANQLMWQDMAAFLRRLVIIAIEDVRVCRGLEKVTWLMAAHSKQFVPQPCHMRGLMGFVNYLSNEPVYDRIRRIEVFNTVPLWKQISRTSLHMALGVRYGYGGMGGDQRLLIQTMLRLNPDPTTYPQGWTNNDNFALALESVQPFGAAHMMNEAVDFHCTSIANDASRVFYRSCKELKQWIWNYRSSINVRPNQVNHKTAPPRSNLDDDTTRRWHRWLDQNAPKYWCTDMKVYTKPEKPEQPNTLVINKNSSNECVKNKKKKPRLLTDYYNLDMK